jgi:endo-alpha-1,4-polygalactosaminidase (GH114 family)
MRLIGAVSALVGGFVLASAAGAHTAAAPAAADQGERMHGASGSATVARSQGGRRLRLSGRDAASARLRATGRVRVAVRVAGQPCAGRPRMIVALDGARLFSRSIRSRSAITVSTRKTVAAGVHTLTVRLANPHRGRNCVRSLRVGRLALGAAGASPIWQPARQTTWQWQLTGAIDQSVAAQMYDVDLQDSPASLVASLHAKGRRVVCYLSAGSFEDWRPDAADFPAEALGETMDGWPDERWLDIRRIDLLGPIMKRRLDQCRAKGFDGVEPDNVDGYRNRTGFELSAADQLRYNRFLARAAHARGLSIGLKNDLDQVKALEPDFDWAINEQCFQYDECETLAPFVRAGKAVFNVEYGLLPAAFCDKAKAMGLMSMRKTLSLDASRTPCW